MIVTNLNGYANQFLLFGEEVTTFQSYNSKIAEFNRFRDTLKVFPDWDFSNTTRRHFKTFINEETLFIYENKAQWIKEMKKNPCIEEVL